VQKVAVSVQARNDYITYVAEDIDYSHMHAHQYMYKIMQCHTSGSVFSV